MDNSFASLVESSASILVVLPTKPTFDQVAAALSLYLALRDSKETAIYSPSQMTVGFNRLIGVNKITPEVGNKNLTVKFVNYDGNNIDKVKADLEGNEFVLTVIPKTGFVSPKKEQLDFSYSGAAADLVILVGGANDSHFPILSSKELAGVKIAHIGTRTLASSLEVMSFAKPGASSSELIANLVKENNLTLDADTATNLVMGIEDGSSNFASPEVSPETFETFAYLLRNGGTRSPRVKLSPASFPPGSIPTRPFNQVPQNIVRQNQPIQPKPIQPEPVIEPEQGQEPLTAIENKEEVLENPPEDWLQPKVFKGTTVS